MSHTRVRHDFLDRSAGEADTLVFTTNETHGEGGREGDPHAAWDDRVARAIGRVLHGHYRGHCWNVWVSRAHGIAKIWISVLMNPQTPYVLRLSESITPGDVMRAGGEILERYGIPRSGVDFAAIADARARLGPLAARMTPPGGFGRI